MCFWQLPEEQFSNSESCWILIVNRSETAVHANVNRLLPLHQIKGVAKQKLNDPSVVLTKFIMMEPPLNRHAMGFNPFQVASNERH